MRFVDEVEITVASGKGGDGAVSFRREAHVPRGGPDGGDGGRGGAVAIVATRNRNTLVDYRWRRIHRAADGQAGMPNQMFGAAAEDVELLVPLGTLIFDAESGEALADLAEEGARYEIHGGKGGKGNVWFKTSTRQTPTFAEQGKLGEERKLRLELRLLADVGLLGYPNAGKSTLISRISAAKPKVADYPFTTLAPHLGVVSIAPGESFVVADIPGLIEGASEGRGLGHQFLRHVERCRLYLHLVEPGDDAVTRWQVIQDELRAYDPELLDRPQILVLSKIDTLAPDERAATVAALEAATGQTVHPLSAVAGEGVQELIWAMWSAVRPPEDPSDSSSSGPTL
jgi:GTP-binding protein